MCGIVGLHLLNNDLRPRLGELLTTMLDAMTTRGPDSAGLAVYSDETALSGDDGALVTALLWALALAGVSAAGTFAVTRWSPWPVYLAVAPIALAVLWNLYQSLAALLPNVY